MPISPISAYQGTEDEEPQRHSRMSVSTSESAFQSQKPTGAGVNTGAGSTREKTDAEREADKRYEESMEEEYAKREGGA